MNAKKAEVTKQLTDYLHTEEAITGLIELREHIFEVKSPLSVLGFISLYDLKTFVIDDEKSAQELSIRNIDEKNWVKVFEHAYFQRRKPQLVSASTLEADDEIEFFLLLQGQKTGPYGRFEVSTMLEDKELLLTDMVSINGGHTWSKLYQVEGFDRRTLKSSDQLPGLPEEEIFQRQTQNSHAYNPETDALSGLAYLGNVKRGKVIEREKIAHYEEEMTKKAGNSTLYKWLLAISLLGIGYFLYNIKNQLSSPFGPAQSPIGEQAEMLTPVELTPTQTMNQDRNHNVPVNQFNDNRRSGKFEARTLAPIRPNQRKSFLETGKYQEIKNSDNGSGAEDDSNYFYDNTSAMELDPVRTQVSKETHEAPLGEPAPLESGDALFDEEVSR